MPVPSLFKGRRVSDERLRQITEREGRNVQEVVSLTDTNL